MIDKLYSLKKSQTDQKMIFKAEIMNSIDLYNTQIDELKKSITTASVDRFGAISDFTVLEMHKNTLRMNVKKLESQRSVLLVKLKKLDIEIVELQKQKEQYAYILNEQKKEAFKKLLKEEEEASSEFVQSKYAIS